MEYFIATQSLYIYIFIKSHWDQDING